MRRGWSAGALGLVLALVLAGCVGQGEPEQVSTPRSGAETTGQLTVWGWDASIKSLKVVDAGFRQAYPNITVKYVAKPPADTYRNIQLALSAGSGAPDVSVIENSHLAQFVKLGGLADVTDLVKPYTDQVNAYRWKPATKDGRVYAMPWDSGPVAVFYRRDVFSKAGIDPESILWPLAVLRSDEVQTVPVMLAALQGPPGRTAFDVLMAGSVVSVLPMLLLFLLLQRHLVVGLTAGAVRE